MQRDRTAADSDVERPDLSQPVHDQSDEAGGDDDATGSEGSGRDIGLGEEAPKSRSTRTPKGRKG